MLEVTLHYSLHGVDDSRVCEKFEPPHLVLVLPEEVLSLPALFPHHVIVN